MAKKPFTGSKSDIEMRKRAERKIAHGALTNSKRPESFVKGFYPNHVVAGHGVHLIDTRNFRYVDFICGLGVNLLGYGFSPVVEAVSQAMRHGPTFSLSSVKEIELAEAITDIMPFVEKVKFLKSGSEGCSAAVRIARAYTGKNVLVSDAYHGWHDEFVSLTPPANGVPPHPFIKPLSPNLVIGEDVGAVIIEPIVTELSDARIAWLRDLREECTKKGALLIFDETITALRFPKYCVANFTGITPDLIIFGKALGNGLPLSCVGGRADVMDCDYFVSSTFAGETASIASAIAVLRSLRKTYDINHLWNSGERFRQRFNEISTDVKIEGYPTRGVLVGDDMSKAILMQEACRSGILLGSSWFYAFPHIELEDQVLNIMSDVQQKIKSGGCRLEGDLPKKPIAQQIREVKAA